MTVNVNTTPNSVHLTGDTTLHHHFGAIQYVKARPLCSDPHIDVRFDNHVRWELSPETATDLQRQLLIELAACGFIPEVHDAIADGESA